MLDKILSFIAAFMAKTTTTTRISPAIGEGNVHYMQVGKIVIVTGLIATTTALTAGEILATGLPTSKVNNPLFIICNSNSSSDLVHYGYVNNQNNVGLLRYFGTAAAASRSFRFSVVYIAS